MLLIVSALLIYYLWKFRRLLPVRSLKMDEVRQVLISYFAYYRHLPEADRKHFEQRVVRFIGRKRFIARNMGKVTLEMKVLVAASAVQLTFGLPEVVLMHFDKILIYPDQYFSFITRKKHKGEVNPGVGAIVLSWKNFVEGYARPHDAYNLGLHEMAHALKLENIIENGEHGFLPAKLMKEWREQASVLMQEIREGRQQFFRAYAATNEYEFFAVAVENFFEKPADFSRHFPVLYRLLVKILNQDPLISVGGN